MSDWQSMRASDADRERAADVLKAALAEGRLEYEEHTTRLGQLMRAQTYGEIQLVTGDLPTSGIPFPTTAPGQLVQPTQAAVNPWAGNYRPNQRPTEGLATASLVLGIMGFFCGITSIPAIVTGHLALARIKENGSQGHGLAIGGLIFGYAFSVLIVFMIIGAILD